MKQAISKFLSAALLCNLAAPKLFADGCCGSSNSSSSSVITAFTPRSQGRNKVVQVVGTAGHQHIDDMESWYGTFDATFEFARSFHGCHIANCFFGPALVTTTTTGSTPANSCDTSCKDSCDKLLIQGCLVPGRNANALAAGNFFLPEDFSSEVSIKPEIKNFNVHFGLYVGFDEWLGGAYFRVHGPVSHTRWRMNLSEKEVAAGTGISAGVLTPGVTPVAPAVLPRTSVYANFSEYIAGERDLGTVDTVKFTPLAAGRIASCERSRTGFADLRFELGWNFMQCADYHIGINVQAVAPTGTKRESAFLFDPVIGNDKAELGLGMTAHYTFWRNESEDTSIGFWLDASVTHLFKSSENRVFDLKNKPLSRYLMASKFKTPAVNLNATPAAIINSQFALEFAPVANLTARNVDVSIKAQGDVVAWFNATWCGWSFDLGYNFWGRSCEDIKEDCDCTNDALKTGKWALRGNSQMFGFVAATTPGVALSATQSKATIFSCLNTLVIAPANGLTANGAIDAPFPATDGAAAALLTAPAGGVAINTSVQPILLTPADVDLGGGSRGTSHKLFAHVNYTWDRECWIPFIGFGAAGEWGSKGKHCDTSTTTTPTTSTSCDSKSCGDCALSQWSVWVKLGVSFN